MKLFAKLSTFTILLAFVPLALIGNLAYVVGRRTIEQQTYNQMISIGALKESEFNRWVKDNSQKLSNLAQRPLVRSYTAILTRTGTDPDDPDHKKAAMDLLVDHLLPAAEHEGGFLDFFILQTEDGQIIIGTDQVMVGKIRSNQDYFNEGKDQTYVDQVVYSLSEGMYNMHFSTPILDETGNTLAVLVGHADLEDMATIIGQNSGSTSSENNYLVNAYNFFVTDPMNGEGYSLRKTIFSEGVDTCLTGTSGTAVYDNYQGTKVLGAYRWMPDYGLCLLTEMDQVEALATIESYRATMLQLVFIIAVAAVFLSLFFSNNITEPLRKLVESALEIGRGNLDYRIEIKGGDEMSTLARAFNEMTANLQKITSSRDDLNQEINQRKKVEKDLMAERDKAQRYLDVAGTIFVVVDKNYKVSLINKAGCKMIGASENEIVGQDWFETYVPERNSGDLRVIHNLMLAGEMELVEYYENPVLAKDGTEKLIAWHNTLLFDDEGNIQSLLSSGEDITERRQAEERLRIKDFAFESSISADSIGNNEGILTHANQAFASIWGYENAGEVIGKSILDFLADQEEANQIIETIAKTGKWAGEYKALKKDGSTFIALSFANAVYDKNGNQTALYSSVMDISDRKQVEQEIYRLNQELEQRVQLRTAQLEEANKELESFSYSVSHDLRAPLRAIDGFSRILLDEHSENLPPGAQRYLGLIRNNTTDMDKLIDDLLAFSRFSSQEPVKVKVSPNDVVSLILAEREPEIEKRNLELIIADLPDCQADPALLKRVYVNLVDNAIKFTRDANPARIEIGHQQLNGEVVYYVKDNGVGFDMQYADQLFDVFQRLHRTDDFKGTGVGLAIVLRIIRRHGGRIWAEAEVNKGATFFFTLSEKIQSDG